MKGKFSNRFLWHAFHCLSGRSLTIWCRPSRWRRDQEVGGRGPGGGGYGGVAVAPSQAVFTLLVRWGREAGGIGMAAVLAEQGAPLSGDEGGTVRGAGVVYERRADATAVCVVAVLLWEIKKERGREGERQTEKEGDRGEKNSGGCVTGSIGFSFQKLTLKAPKLLGIASG